MAKRRYGITEARIAKLEKMGRGQGRGTAYRPWLTIHDLSSHGRSHRIRGATAGRIHHFMSDIELAVFLECDWHPDVFDIREQFPLDRRSTRWIAAEMGVRHPRHRGVDIVMTTDLLIDIKRGGGGAQVAIAVKPARLLRGARIREKLEIERRYWAERGVPLRVITEEKVNRVRTLNLHWLHEARWLEHLDMPHPDHWRRRCAVLLRELSRAGECSIHSFTSFLEAAQGWERGAALFAVRHMAANRVLEIDLDIPFDASAPIARLRPAPGLLQMP